MRASTDRRRRRLAPLLVGVSLTSTLLGAVVVAAPLEPQTPVVPARSAEIGSLRPGPVAQFREPARRGPAPQALDQGPDTIPENIQVSRDGDTEGSTRPVTDFSEVHLAASPVDPDHLLGSSKFFFAPERYGFYTGVFESFDGGLSWEQLQPEGIEVYSLTSDPVNAFDDEGSGYFTLLTRGPTGLDMMRKRRGEDWGLPVPVDRSTNTDKQWIAADMNPAGSSPHAGNLYMSWTAVGGDGLPTRIVFSRSTNRNATWSQPPLELDRGPLQGSVVAAGPDGTVHVVYGQQIFGSAVRGSIRHVLSTDGGESFSAPRDIAATTSVPFQLPGSVFRTPASLPAMAVSPVDGRIFVTWADYATGDADILLTRSTDGGESWDPPLRLNDDPLAGGADQFQPQVSVAPDGRVAVAWLDRRVPCPAFAWIPEDHVGRTNFCIDTYLSRSYDGGESWGANRRVSAQSWDPSINLPMVNDTTGFIGDYIGLAGTPDFDYPFFPSTANLGQNPDNRQQVFVARVPAEDPPFDLVPSQIQLSPDHVVSGQALSVTLQIVNRGPLDAGDSEASLVLPPGVDYIEGSLTATGGSGTAIWQPGARQALWTGALTAGQSVTLRLSARVAATAEEGSYTVRSLLRDDTGRRYLRRAELLVSQPPHLVLTSPPDAAIDVVPTSIVLARFDKPMEPTSLVVTSDPPVPGGFFEPSWSADRQSLTLRHARPFDYGTRYTLTIEASDETGAELAPGPIPNPWSFTTEPAPVYTTHLPWLALRAERAEP